MIDKLEHFLSNKRILILGMGIEGKSTYAVLNHIVRPNLLELADINDRAFDAEQRSKHRIRSGAHYLENIYNFDLVIKSPGIPVSSLPADMELSKVTSQTNLFLSAFADQTVGVTGTKGKSTTSSLIHYIISSYRDNTVLVGNIGLPPFDFIDQMDDQTLVVYELSSHQLADVASSPHVAAILNIFEEHLDHYQSFDQYKKAKFNIGKFQKPGDYLIVNRDNIHLENYFEKNGHAKRLWFSDHAHQDDGAYVVAGQRVVFQLNGAITQFDFSNRTGLPGDHNLLNIMAAVCASKLAGIPDHLIQKAVIEFKGLEHRLEFAGEYGGIRFYNDSISTIPESTMAAIRTLKEVDTLILGGKDRGINYSGLIDFLPKTGIRNFILTGDAGKRILAGLSGNLSAGQKTFFVERFEDFEPVIRNHTKKGSVCLLSPAASSYDQFKNFEERGRLFKKIAGSLGLPAS